MKVVMAVDGQQAVTMAQSENPDLILMDMSLPVIDGWRRRGGLKPPERPLTFPSSRLRRMPCPAIARRALGAGCDDYDTKPIEMPRLLEKIDALLAPRPLG